MQIKNIEHYGNQAPLLQKFAIFLKAKKPANLSNNISFLRSYQRAAFLLFFYFNYMSH